MVGLAVNYDIPESSNIVSHLEQSPNILLMMIKKSFLELLPMLVIERSFIPPHLFSVLAMYLVTCLLPSIFLDILISNK